VRACVDAGSERSEKSERERPESGSFTSFAYTLTFMYCATPRIAGGILDARGERARRRFLSCV